MIQFFFTQPTPARKPNISMKKIIAAFFLLSFIATVSYAQRAPCKKGQNPSRDGCAAKGFPR